MDPASGLMLAIDETTTNDPSTNIVHLIFTKSGDRCEYWADLDHGAVPRRIEETSASGKFKRIIQYDDLREIAGVGTFPYIMTIATGPSDVRQWRAVKANFADKPASSAYELRFDKPISVLNQTTSMLYERQATLDVTRLPAAGADVRPVNVGATAPPPLPLERTGRSPTPFILSVIGVVLVTLAYLRWRRR